MKIVATVVRRLMLWSNVLLAIGLLLSFFIPFTNPATFWLGGFAGLPFPFFWIACVCFIPLWIVYRRKYWLISLLAVAVTVTGVCSTWGFHLFGGNKTASDNSFTLMTYNCSSMGIKGYKEVPEVRNRMYEELQKASPDVLCLQEFYSNTNPDKPNNFDSIRKMLNYPYHYFVRSLIHWDTWHYGTVIFSRFPIIDTMRVKMFDGPGGPGSEDLIAASLLIKGDTIRIMSAHLASYKLKEDDYKTVASAEVHKAHGLLYKMRRTFKLRSDQANRVRNEIDRSRHPLIMVGDFNDVPVSYTYRAIRGDLQDAFLKEGSGFGRTFSAISPTLRIDYILPDKMFHVEDFAIYRRRGFEHFPIMARLSINRKD
ncbi:hypothetical protein GFS24_14795 [Chitinophaga sp. SYP-B3965]|uniref:endonuclease/exonuclease/phosphatase family protein n=1 Tax=Chitinophaga sp. SYP-B3965 TaxID=2663120 RepID=UPI001299E835|nr:endonuclease/exonuclease/phosphatase family protein [Chitinophaga sp. SYP-B3965]MRG46388.1 hypothetical protein [Chitinophaga sp. SYP-B3965]